MSTDLDRIPAPYRERVQRIVTAAEAAAAEMAWPEDVDHACRIARSNMLAPFLAIADEADAAMHRAADEARRNHPSAPDREQLAHDLGMAERSAVWARRTAEHGEHHDCPACTAQTAAMRERDAAPADAMRAEADEQRDPMAATMMRMTASAWTSAAAAPEDDTVPPDLAPEGFFFGTVSVNGEMVINDGQGAQAALDGLVRYLETHVSAMPVDLVQRAILALSMTLPAGPLAPTPEPVATLGVIVSLLRTLPIGRMPTVCLGGGAAGYELLAARDGARTYTIAGTDETPPLRCVYVEYDGIEIKARCTRDEVP